MHFSKYDLDIFCEISKDIFENPLKVFYTDIERCDIKYTIKSQTKAAPV